MPTLLLFSPDYGIMYLSATLNGTTEHPLCQEGIGGFNGKRLHAGNPGRCKGSRHQPLDCQEVRLGRAHSSHENRKASDDQR